MSDDGAPSPRRRVRVAGGVSTLVGGLVAVAGGVFVAGALSRQWEDARHALADASAGWLVAGVVLAGAGMVAIALPWPDAARLLGAHLPRLRSLPWYFLGEIGKYVPGGVWPVVGRAELAQRNGVARPAAYGSVALSLAALYLAAMFLVVVLLPARLASSSESAGPLWVLALLPVGLVLLHHRVLGWLVEVAERVFRRPLDVTVPPWRDTLGLVVRYVPAWTLIATATWCVARAFVDDVSWLDVAFATLISWITGFVLVPVPGGVGVREATFVAVVGLPAGVAAVVAIVARLGFIAVDAAGALLSVAALRRLGQPVERAVPND